MYQQSTWNLSGLSVLSLTTKICTAAAYQTPHVWALWEYRPNCAETRTMTASMPVIAYWDCRGLAQPIRKHFKQSLFFIYNLLWGLRGRRSKLWCECLRITLSGCCWSMAVKDTRTEWWICRSRIGWHTRPRLDSTFLIFHITRSNVNYTFFVYIFSLGK